MTDARGGRYSREARFFLAGDKAVAQSHILEARGLMGYMRDMHALGGPPIQVKYATLQDGTQIKAVMMNGKYQAEIVSPSLSTRADKPKNIPTIAGYQSAGTGLFVEAQAFKWQEKTGVAFLPFAEDYNTSFPLSISADGSIVAGKMQLYTVVGLVVTLVKSTWVYWDAKNVPHLVPEISYEHILDVQNNQTELIDVIPASLAIEATPTRFGIPSHRYAPGLRHQYFGYSNVGGFSAAVVDELPDGTEVIALHETGSPGGYSAINQADYSGNTMVGEYGTGSVVKWKRAGVGTPYARAAVHPSLVARSAAPCVSGDGTTVGGSVIQSRQGGAIIDEVPVLWSERYGLEQLEPFWSAPGSSSPILQIQCVNAITHDGEFAGGYVSQSPDSVVKAWKRGVDGTWGPIPLFDNAFFGTCLVAN